MKLIVDIPDKVYNEYREGVMSMENNCIIGNAVFDGIPYEEGSQGKWIDHSEDGYVECPFCNCLTNCDDNIDELHYCWNCGAEMRGAE